MDPSMVARTCIPSSPDRCLRIPFHPIHSANWSADEFSNGLLAGLMMIQGPQDSRSSFTHGLRATMPARESESQRGTSWMRRGSQCSPMQPIEHILVEQEHETLVFLFN